MSTAPAEPVWPPPIEQPNMSQEPVIVPVPGPDPATALPPEFFNVRKFVRYDENGRIVETGQQGVAFILAEKIQGTRIIEGDGEGKEQTHWVDAENGTPTLTERPTLADIPPTLTVKPGVEAVIPGLPPCEINFTGPLNGKQHNTSLGDVLIGFRVPGTYRIAAEPWPYRPISIELKVSLL